MTKPAKWYGSHWIRRSRRRAIYVRDNHRCVYCGIAAGVTLDHVVAVSKGGTHATSNLVTACRACNHSKAATTLRAFAKSCAARQGITTRALTNRIRKQLRAPIDLRAARTALEIERDAREEREAIRSADTGVHTFVEEAFDFPFGALALCTA